MRLLETLRKIRACESEAAAQIVLEHAIAKAVKAWTDYPFEFLGDREFTWQSGPVREVKVLSYDGDKYCCIQVEGWITEVKAGYLYQSPGRYGEVDPLLRKQLKELEAKG